MVVRVSLWADARLLSIHLLNASCVPSSGTQQRGLALSLPPARAQAKSQVKNGVKIKLAVKCWVGHEKEGLKRTCRLNPEGISC